jgi:two-component sensor histidine kinase
MLREIHHRVKNNMQIISSLLRLQSRGLSDPVALDKFNASQTRIRAMALIHESLYKSEDLTRIDFEGYVRKHVEHLFSLYGPESGRLRLNLDIQDIFLNINKAIPCGLIINELVTNAIKHGFPGDRAGEIAIRMKREPGDKIALRVSDDGAGLPPGLDLQTPETLGIQIVFDLVRQLEGTIELSREKGTAFSLVFAA